MNSTKVTSKNQTTIPEEIRKFLGIKPGEKVEWIIEGDTVILKTKRRYENPLEIIKTLQIDTKKDVKTLRKEAETEMIKEAAK
jgi:antitoxin PrlF